jgi:hypothetical protein
MPWLHPLPVLAYSLESFRLGVQKWEVGFDTPLSPVSREAPSSILVLREPIFLRKPSAYSKSS